MGAAMSVAKNVASHTSTSSTTGEAAANTTPTAAADAVVDKAAVSTSGASKVTNGESPRADIQETIPPSGDSNGLVDGAPPEQTKTAAKSDAPAPARKSSLLFGVGGGNAKQPPEQGGVADRRSSGAGGQNSRGSSPAAAPSGAQGAGGGDRARKKSSECHGFVPSAILLGSYSCAAPRPPEGYVRMASGIFDVFASIPRPLAGTYGLRTTKCKMLSLTCTEQPRLFSRSHQPDNGGRNGEYWRWEAGERSLP